jgi:hypothetical protein
LSGLIAGLDIQNGELIVEGFLGVEGIQELEVLDATAWTTVQDVVEQVDQQGTRRIASE